MGVPAPCPAPPPPPQKFYGEKKDIAHNSSSGAAGRMRRIAILICYLAGCKGSVDFFRQLLEPEIFLAHGLRGGGSNDGVDGVVQILESTLLSDTNAMEPVYVCGPLTNLKKKMSKIASKYKSSQNHVVYVKKSEEKGCFVCHISPEEVKVERALDTTWTLEYMPPVLKIHSTILQYLSYLTHGNSKDLSQDHTQRRTTVTEEDATTLQSTSVKRISKHKVRRTSRRDKLEMKSTVSSSSSSSSSSSPGGVSCHYCLLSI